MYKRQVHGVLAFLLPVIAHRLVVAETNGSNGSPIVRWSMYPLGRRVAVTLAATGTAVLPAACGGGDAGGEMRLTLTDAGCTYEGDETPAAGMLTIEVENQSSKEGAFALGSIAAGSTIDDLEAYGLSLIHI